MRILAGIMVFGAVIILAVPGSFPASALNRVLGVIGTDEREHVYEAGAPWDAIGQINISGYRSRGMCTGTLIGPDRVVTAAHCLLDPRTNTAYAASRIHFLAGVRGGDHKGHATAKCVRFFAGRDTARGDTRRAVNAAEDAAIIILNHKIDVPPARFTQSHSDRRGQFLVHAAYGFDRRFGLSAHFGCRLTRIAGVARLWFNDCDTSPASSGGPVFIKTGEQLSLAAIMIAAGGRQENIENIAWPLANWGDLDLVSACAQNQGGAH